MKTAKAPSKTTKAKTSVSTTPATETKAVKPVTPKSKASMLGLAASAIQAHQDGHDVSEVTSKVPGLTKAVKRMAKTAKADSTSTPKEAAIRNKGPRGFRVDSPAWMASIQSGKGIALSPANLPKLLDTAAVHNVEISEDLTQAEIVEKISKALVAA